jgi:serine/threonine protein phosphatase 1
MRSYIIGDIHGCQADLAELIEKLPLNGSDRIVFLGDYIDRGPASCGVVSYLLELQKQRVCELVFLKGNHEDMLLSYLGLGGRHGEVFLYNGGRATVASYGLTSGTPNAQELLLRIPPEHLAFYQNLKTYFVMDRFLCVHAGINPLKSLENQAESEVLWIRDKFIYSPHPLPYTVAFGHTPASDVFYDLPYKIGLDTGLVFGNKLSCLETEEKVLYQITRGEKNVRQISIREKWNPASPSLTP